MNEYFNNQLAEKLRLSSKSLITTSTVDLHIQYIYCISYFIFIEYTKTRMNLFTRQLSGHDPSTNIFFLKDNKCEVYFFYFALYCILYVSRAIMI